MRNAKCEMRDEECGMRNAGGGRREAGGGIMVGCGTNRRDRRPRLSEKDYVYCNTLTSIVVRIPKSTLSLPLAK